MTRDTIIKLAREADAAHDNVQVTPFLERFAALIAATEREACAVTAWSAGMDAHNAVRGLPCDARDVGSKAAAAIRARSNHG